MSKPITAWTTNPTKNIDAIEYSDATVEYSDANTSYVSLTVGENQLNKPQTEWAESPSA